MQHGVTTASENVWRGIFIAICVGVVTTVVGGLILLVIEHKSAFFNSPSRALHEGIPEPDNHSLNVKKALPAIPNDVPQVQLKPDVKIAPLPQAEPKTAKPVKVEPEVIKMTFEHFAHTYESFSERDRTTYLQSIAGKRIQWTGYINQIFLTDNYLYLAHKKDGSGIVNVSVNFGNDMRLNVGPLGTKIRVSGVVEIRGQWVIIDASALAAAP